MRILFVCYANACRSQMAEAYARARAPQAGVEIASAGKRAAGVWPESAEAMEAWGLDMSSHRSKTLDEVDPASFDLVISLSDRVKRLCDEHCPESVRRIHWPILDPASARGSDEEIREVFAFTREDLADEIDELFEGLFGPLSLRPVRPGAGPA